MELKLSAVLLAAITCLICIVFNISPSIGAVKAGHYGYINKTGKLVVKPQFGEAKNFLQGLAAVKIDDKWGYTNKTGKLVIKPAFSDAYSFSEGLAAVKLDNKWGYIDKTGKMLITPQFIETYGFSEGLAAVKIDSSWGYIDKTGKVVISPQFREAYSFSEGSAVVNIDYKWGYIDKTGKQIIRAETESGTEIIQADRFSQGLAAVETGGSGTCGVVFCAYGYIAQTGKIVVEPKFFDARKFSEELAAVATYGGTGTVNANGNSIDDWGYIDKQGQLVIKPIFNQASSFSEGLAAVNIGNKFVYSNKPGDTSITEIAGKWGYIDKTGKQVVPIQFDLANSFSEGLAAVKVKDKCGYINKIGKVVVKRRFSACADFSEGLAAVKTSI